MQGCNFGRKGFAEIAHFIDGSNLDLAGSRHRVRALLQPGDGFGHVLDVPYPIARDDFFGLGEGTIDDQPVRSVECDPLALLGMKRLENSTVPEQRQTGRGNCEQGRGCGEEGGDLGLLALHHELRVKRLIDFLQVGA